jgi:hypothetical protein
MSDDDEILTEFQESASVLRKLAEDEKVFQQSLDAYHAGDHETFKKILDRFGLLVRCRLVCRWYCTWHCTRLCRILCGDPPEKEHTLPELRALAAGLVRLTDDPAQLERVLKAVEGEDRRAWGAALEPLKLGPFCHIICSWICAVRCHVLCELICKPVGVPLHEALVKELRESARAIATLAENEQAFTQVFEAANKNDIKAVRDVLGRVDLLRRCRLICHWFCVWRCVRVCFILCRRWPLKDFKAPELREFIALLGRLAENTALLKELEAAHEKEDADAFERVLKQAELLPFCVFICRWFCFFRCYKWCRILCPPPDPLPLWRKIGAINYLTQIDSASAGDGRTLADDRAFFGGLRLNGVYYKTLNGQPMEYRFEIKPAAAPDVDANWAPVQAGQIGRTIIGTWSRWTGTTTESKDYTVNGANGPDEITVLAAADGWIKVPQENDFWNPAGTGFFSPGENMITLLTTTIAAWPSINITGIHAGDSTAPATLGQDEHFSIRYRVRQVGSISATTAGQCDNLAVYNRLYDHVTHGGSWAPADVSNQLGVVMLNIDEIATGCGGISNALTVRYTAAHPNLGAVDVGMTGPGGPYGFTLTDAGGATPPNRFGTAAITPPATIAGLKNCAYIVDLSAVLLLTTGDSVPDPIHDVVAFCKK